MKKYKYSKSERELNKAIKYNQILSHQLEKDINETKNVIDDSINSCEELLISLGYEDEINNIKNKKECKKKDYNKSRAEVREWNEIISEANNVIDYDVDLNDILSSEEFKMAYDDLDRINREFSRKIKLNKVDISFLMIATALQTLRWILMPELGKHINPDGRISHDDKRIKDEVKEKNKEFKEKHLKSEYKGGTWELKKDNRKTWMDIWNS